MSIPTEYTSPATNSDAEILQIEAKTTKAADKDLHFLPRVRDRLNDYEEPNHFVDICPNRTIDLFML